MTAQRLNLSNGVFTILSFIGARGSYYYCIMQSAALAVQTYHREVVLRIRGSRVEVRPVATYRPLAQAATDNRHYPLQRAGSRAAQSLQGAFGQTGGLQFHPECS